MEIRRNWSYRYLNLFIISVSFEFVTSFYKAKMFKRAKKVKKIDISLKMYFKASLSLFKNGHIRVILDRITKPFIRKNAPAFLDTFEIVWFLLFHLFKHFRRVKMCI